MSKGNHLAGEDRMERVTVRVHADRLERFDEAVADSEDWDNRSEAIRDLMDDAMGHGTPSWLPADPRLAAGYRALRRQSHPETHKITTEAAKSAVAESTRIQKESVKDRVLRPLQEAGLLAPKYGTLYVRVPDE